MAEEQKNPPQNAGYFVPYCPPPSEEDDEIDLRELAATIGRYKVKIAVFAAVVTSAVLLWLLATPNSYTSKAVLAPQEQSKGPSLGGLSALAGMAGISLGGAQIDAFTSLQTILGDYGFQKYVIEKYDLIDRWHDKNLTKDYVFAMGYDGLFKLTHTKPKFKSHEEALFKTYQAITKSVTISSDKKSGAITLSATHPSRHFAKELVMIYLDETVNRLRENEMADVDKKIAYYEKALGSTENIQLREQLSQMISSLIQKKVLAQSNRYYNVQPIIMPDIPNVMDKTKPKRGLVLVVALITSLLLGIFGAFFAEFLKNSKEENKEEAKG